MKTFWRNKNKKIKNRLQIYKKNLNYKKKMKQIKKLKKKIKKKKYNNKINLIINNNKMKNQK